MSKYKNYTDEDIIQNSKTVKSLSQLLRALDLRVAGGNYDNMKRNLQRLNIDTSHWTGQAWNKDAQLKDWSDYSRGANLKPHLIKERGHSCESCALETWLDQPIALEIEHKDGDRTNNCETNLELLCPNCHAQTLTWRRRKSSLSTI